MLSSAIKPNVRAKSAADVFRTDDTSRQQHSRPPLRKSVATVNPPQPFGRLARFLAGVALTLACAVLGISLGLLWVKLTVSARSMGWDAIADMLGGIVVGGALGLLAGAWLSAGLSAQARWWSAGAGTLLSGLLLAILAWSAPPPKTPPGPAAKWSFEPHFRIGLRISHTRQALSAVPANERPWPFVEASIVSSKPELVLTGWGPQFQRCKAKPTEADLRLVIPLLQQLVGASGDYCRTPEEDLALSANWSLKGNRGNQGLHSGCLAQHPGLRALADGVARIGQRYCATPDITAAR